MTHLRYDTGITKAYYRIAEKSATLSPFPHLPRAQTNLDEKRKLLNF